MVARLNQPNILLNVEDTFSSLLSDSFYEEHPIMACVNSGKHVKCMTFSEVKELETHVKECFNFKGKLSLKVRKGTEEKKKLKKVVISIEKNY